MKSWTIYYTFGNSKKDAGIYLRVVKIFFLKIIETFLQMSYPEGQNIQTMNYCPG